MSVQVTQDFASQTKALIDNLKTICASAGLGNDGNEFKIITQTFLYKFMNDKFGYEIKERHPELKTAESWEKKLESLPNEQYTLWLKTLPAESARLRPEHLISALFNRTNEPEFAKLFDDTLRDISILNANVFSIKTDSGQKDKLFDELSNYITDSSKRDDFCVHWSTNWLISALSGYLRRSSISLPRYSNISLRTTTRMAEASMPSITRLTRWLE